MGGRGVPEHRCDENRAGYAERQNRPVALASVDGWARVRRGDDLRLPEHLHLGGSRDGRDRRFFRRARTAVANGTPRRAFRRSLGRRHRRRSRLRTRVSAADHHPVHADPFAGGRGLYGARGVRGRPHHGLGRSSRTLVRGAPFVFRVRGARHRGRPDHPLSPGPSRDHPRFAVHDVLGATPGVHTPDRCVHSSPNHRWLLRHSRSGDVRALSSRSLYRPRFGRAPQGDRGARQHRHLLHGASSLPLPDAEASRDSGVAQHPPFSQTRGHDHLRRFRRRLGAPQLPTRRCTNRYVTPKPRHSNSSR